jgi:hypothetical protein
MSRHHHRRSSVVEAHNIYVKYHQHDKAGSSEELAELDEEEESLADLPSCQERFKQFRRVEKTGVIYATSRALSHGFHVSFILGCVTQPIPDTKFSLTNVKIVPCQG